MGIRSAMRPSGDIAMGFDYDETLDATTGFDLEAQAVLGATDDEGPSSVERGQRSCRHYCGADCFGRKRRRRPKTTTTETIRKYFYRRTAELCARAPTVRNDERFNDYT